MICVVLYANSISGLEKQATRALELDVQIIEYRLDGLPELDTIKIKNLVENIPCKSIISIRSEWNNQDIVLPQPDRRNSLRSLMKIKPDYIDLEYPIDMPCIEEVEGQTKVVLSMMDFYGMSKIAIDPVVSVATRFDYVTVKISATPKSVADLKQLWSWSKYLHKKKIPNLVIGMGQLGQISRIKSREMGNTWTYGRISDQMGEPMLPGMIDVGFLQKAFSDESWHLAAFGNLTEQNILKSMYTKILAISKLNGIFLNIPIKNNPELDQMLLWVEDGLLDGIAITSPWQENVRSKLNYIDTSVIRAGTCNCVAITKNGLTGFNTEIEGIKRCLEPFSIRSLKRVYIEGTDRISKSIISAVRENAELIVIRGSNDQQLNDIKLDFPEVISAKDSFTDHFDLIVNCAKPEMGFENVISIPTMIIDNAKVVFDPVSRISSKNSLFIKANKNQIPTVDAWTYFINTSIRSFELWTKRSVPSSALKIDNFAMFDEIDLDFMYN